MKMYDVISFEKKSKHRGTLNLFVLSLCLLAVSCSKKVNVGVAGVNEDQLGENEYPPTSVAIKNYDQVNATFSVLTEIPRNNNQVRGAFDQLKASLAVTNDIVTMGPSIQLATFKLAQAYCREGILNPALLGTGGVEIRRLLVPDYDHAGFRNPTQAFGTNPAIKALIVRHFIEKFWGSGIETLPDNAEAEYVALFDELIAGVDPATQNNDGQTRTILWGMCTAVLATSPLVLF